MNNEIPININEEGENKKEPTQKEVIGLKLFDKLNPEMITNVSSQDIDNLSILMILTDEENILRKKLKFEDNIFQRVIHTNLVLRTSLNGWRAEQGVKIITAILDEDKKDLEDGINTRLKRVIGRG